MVDNLQYRIQFRRGNALGSHEEPREGEPFWDSEAMRLGFYNFRRNEIDWFQVPENDDDGGNISYIPEHEFDPEEGLRFKKNNGDWGEWINVQGEKGEKGDTGAAAPKQFYVGPSAPQGLPAGVTYMWLQTGLPDGGTTLWIEDGTI